MKCGNCCVCIGGACCHIGPCSNCAGMGDYGSNPGLGAQKRQRGGCGQCCTCRREAGGFSVCYHTGPCSDCRGITQPPFSPQIPLPPVNPFPPIPDTISVVSTNSETLVLKEILETLKDISRDIRHLQDDVQIIRMHSVNLKN